MTPLVPPTPPRSAERTTATATLLLETGGGIARFTLGGETTVGRDARCGVTIDHPTASRLHARIWHEPTSGHWHYEDLGSQNGSRLNEERLTQPVRLAAGMELRIGRVRAWFFERTPPPDWRPKDGLLQTGGKRVRCRCGYIGWAPDHAAGMTLQCPSCGGDIVMSDAAAHAPAPQTRLSDSLPSHTLAMPAITLVDCAGCHATINPGERSHVCPECAATLHEECWQELRGCAMYGCGQVNVLDREGEPDTVERGTAPSARPTPAAPLARVPAALVDAFARSVPADDENDSLTPPRFGAPARSGGSDTGFRLAQVGLVGLAGLPTFGVPGIAFAAYRVVAADTSGEGNARFVYAALSFVLGVGGFLASGYWWLGMHP